MSTESMPSATSAECARIEELISALQDGAATPAEREQVERHVAGCDSCRATLAAFLRNDALLARYLQTTPVPAIGAPWREAVAALSRATPTSRWVLGDRGTGRRNWRL